MLKTSFRLSLSLLLLTFSPLAAQAQTYNAQPYAPYNDTDATASDMNWQGGYVGLTVGGGVGTSRRDFGVGSPSTTGDFSTSGAIGGGTLGYNVQLPSVVLGLEADLSGSNIDGHADCPNSAFSCHTDNDWLATVRPRLGFPIGPVLPYVTGGLAVGEIHSHSNNNTTNATGTDFTDIEPGWTAGGGIEVPIWDRLSFKVEYLYVQLEEAEGASNNTNPALSHAPSYVHFDANIGRAGLNYRF